MNYKTKRTLFKVIKLDFSKYMVYIIFAAVVVIFMLWLGKTFFSVTNLLNILRQTAMIAVMAVGMTFVIATSEIDLSVSGTVPLAGVFAAMLLRDTNNLVLAIFVPILFGGLVGLINGLITTKFHIPSFLATLGIQGVLKGVAMWVTSTSTIPIYNKPFINMFGYTSIGPIPISFLWILFALIVGHYALNYNPFGKKVLAIGGNSTAAKYTGISVDKYKIATFVILGVCAAISGLLYAGRTETARFNFGDGDELNVIASVVIGGTALSGGKGSVMGGIIGAILIGMINNGLIIGGLQVSQQMIARGLIIILAVTLNSIGNMKHKQ